MKKLSIFITAFSLCFSTVAFTQNRCPAGSSGCTMNNVEAREKEIVNGGAKDYFSSSSTYESGTESVTERVKGAAGILKDCLNCAMDAVKDGMNQVSGGKSSDSDE